VIYCGVPGLKFPFYLSCTQNFKSVFPNSNKCSNFYVLGLFCLSMCEKLVLPNGQESRLSVKYIQLDESAIDHFWLLLCQLPLIPSWKYMKEQFILLLATLLTFAKWARTVLNINHGNNFFSLDLPSRYIIDAFTLLNIFSLNNFLYNQSGRTLNQVLEKDNKQLLLCEPSSLFTKEIQRHSKVTVH